MVAGDFKSPLFPSNKCGGLIDYSNSMVDLAEFINRNGLMDVDLRGKSFT